MNRGFALLAVLWVLTALAVLAGVGLAVVRTGADTTRNRILLARSGWASDACLEILQARYAQDSTVRALDTVELGRGTWCRASLEDLGAKLNVNTAGFAALTTVLRSVVRDTALADSLAATIIASRRVFRFVAIPELVQWVGLDSTQIGPLESAFTTDGPGTIDVNAAPPAILGAVPGMTEEAVGLLLDRRTTGRTIQSLAELGPFLAEGARTTLFANERAFRDAATFTSAEFRAVADGGVRGTPIVTRVTVLLIPLPGRLAVIREERE